MADPSPPVRLHHWLYGVTRGEGYGIKAASAGLNIALFEAPLRNHYTPIRGDTVQSSGGVDFRMIHPAASAEDVLLSRLGRGPADELGRPTFQNHIAIASRDMLESGAISLFTVDAALKDFDTKNPAPTKELAPLEVAKAPKGYRPGAGLRQHLTRAAVETLATRRIQDEYARTLILCRDTPPAVRNEILFRLIELLNFVAGIEPFTGMSDAPTASAMNDFNLVVAPRGIRGDNSWAIIESSVDASPLKPAPRSEAIYAAIQQSYAADSAF